jgi:hypothetical protein
VLASSRAQVRLLRDVSKQQAIRTATELRKVEPADLTAHRQIRFGRFRLAAALLLRLRDA